MSTALSPCLDTLQHHFQHYAQQHRPTSSAPLLNQAIQHLLNQPGKQLRALLIYATGSSLQTSLSLLAPPALAVECIHSYSLLHDDLPAMDNADWRRGQISCHKKFSEAEAILAGDALLTWAFEHLSTTQALDAASRCHMITTLAQACGPHGMVAGQSLDLNHRPIHLSELKQIHALKTGALIKACFQLGCIAAGQSWNASWAQLAETLGAAYQLQDDYLDATSNLSTLGKPAGLDQQNQKITMASLTSLEAVKHQLADQTEALNHYVEALSLSESPLHQLIQQVMQRSH